MRHTRREALGSLSQERLLILSWLGPLGRFVTTYCTARRVNSTHVSYTRATFVPKGGDGDAAGASLPRGGLASLILQPIMEKGLTRGLLFYPDAYVAAGDGYHYRSILYPSKIEQSLHSLLDSQWPEKVLEKIDGLRDMPGVYPWVSLIDLDFRIFFRVVGVGYIRELYHREG